MTRFKSVVSDIDGTLRNNIEEAAPQLRLDKRGSHAYAGFLFMSMHVFKRYSTKKILRGEGSQDNKDATDCDGNGCDGNGCAGLEEEGVNILKKYQDISMARTRNNFRDLDMIKSAIRESGADIPVERVVNNDMLHGIEGKVLLLQDNPISALRDVLRHKDAEAILIPRYYNDFLGGIVSRISKRVHMAGWKDVDGFISGSGQK